MNHTGGGRGTKGQKQDRNTQSKKTKQVNGTAETQDPHHQHIPQEGQEPSIP